MICAGSSGKPLTSWLLAAALCLAALSICAGSTTAVAAKTDRLPVATGARLGGDSERTRFVADLSAPVRFNAYVLPDPFRIIVDMDEVNFQLPDGLGSTGRGLIDAYRYGLFDVGKSRIVMDANAPVMIEKSFILEARDGQPARLVIDVIRTDRAAFFKEHEPPPAPDVLGEKIASLTLTDKPQLPPVRPRAVPNRTGGGGESGRSASARRPLIVLDPGHGGVDPGAIGRSGTSEKTVAYKFAKVLRERLRKTKRYDVKMTRTKDTFVRLRDRVNFARRHEADLFIAIHADSIRSGNVRGATIYTLSEKASDKEAGALAAAENRSDIIAGVDLGGETDEVTGILIDLAQRETNNQSVYFAKTLVSAMDQVTRMNSRPHRSAGFRVLKAPDIPSVLLELGYLSSRRDENLLRSDDWRIKTADSVVKAIDDYFTARVARGR